MADTRTSARSRPLNVTDNLPPGASLDIAEAFVRIFRPEIEAQILGIPASTPPARRRGADAATAA